MRPLTIEGFLARIYADAEARAAFLRDPLGEALRAGLPRDVAASMAATDVAGVEATAAALRARTDHRAADGRRR